MADTIKGTFEIKMSAEPPYDVVDGVSLGRATFEKRFSGELDATSTVVMLAARGPIENSAGYVAMERVVGSVKGRSGSFVLMHTGVMRRGARELTVQIVPDSGTGALSGIRGRMTIDVVDGTHHYALEHEFSA